MVSSLLMPAVTTGDVRLVHMIAERGGRANLVDDQGDRRCGLRVSTRRTMGR